MHAESSQCSGGHCKRLHVAGMANTWLISMIASMSVVCVALSALIVAWSCQSARRPSKKIVSA